MTQIFKNHSDFLKRENKNINGVSEQSAIDNPEYVKDNEDNEACWSCYRCSGCYGIKNAVPVITEGAAFKVPIIENIHQAIYEAAKKIYNGLSFANYL